MSASVLTGCLIKSGREDEARGVLRDYANHLESFGGQVTAYQVVYGGELQGRVLITWSATTTRERAEMLEQARLHGIEDNPYLKATRAIDPPLTTYSRIMYRSVEPDLEPLPQSPIRLARVFAAAPGHRADAEEALRIARKRILDIGYSGEGLFLETAGTNSDMFVGATCFNSWTALEELEQHNATDSPPAGGPLDLLARGVLTSISRRVDYAYDLGR